MNNVGTYDTGILVRIRVKNNFFAYFCKAV